jgi:hypothetical protein
MIGSENQYPPKNKSKVKPESTLFRIMRQA